MAAKFLSIILFSLSLSANAGNIHDFSLKDSAGKVHKLYDYADYSAVVVIAHTTACPIMRQKYPDFEALSAQFSGKKVAFFFLNSHLGDSVSKIAREVKDYDVKIPVLKDPDQSVIKDLQFKVSTETAVLDPKDWSVIYRGPIDDQINFDVKKATHTKPWLAEAIQRHLSGKPPEHLAHRTFGCYIKVL